VVKDQREVLVFEGSKLKQKVIAFLDSQLPPLLGVGPIKEGSTRVVGNFLQDGQKRVSSDRVHGLLL